jgi:predicted nucleic acid-binding protein
MLGVSDVYVLDSYAVLALLGDEPGSADVKVAFQRAESGTARVLMSWVNAGEVAYIVQRRWGKEKVYQVLGTLEATRIELVNIDRDLALRAAAIKAGHRLAYADAFAAALTIRENGTLLTGDPEFESLGDIVEIQWLGR